MYLLTEVQYSFALPTSISHGSVGGPLFLAASNKWAVCSKHSNFQNLLGVLITLALICTRKLEGSHARDPHCITNHEAAAHAASHLLAHKRLIASTKGEHE